MTTIHHYIGGELINTSSAPLIENFNPATGECFGNIPNATELELEQAITHAKQAWPNWSKASYDERGQWLKKLSDVIEANLETFAQAETQDTGKPIQLSRTLDIPRAIHNLRFFAQAGVHFSSEAHDMGLLGFNYTLRKPLGIVAAIAPWNLPLYLLTWKIAPALVTGNCVIAKPSELTPLTASLLAEACQEIGLPPGVLSILHGQGQNIGNKLVEHPEIKAISFTGSTLTGQTIARTAAPQFKKLALECGGKNPALIFADIDIEKTAKEVVRSSFLNQGQICLCTSRLLIEQKIYAAFKTALIHETKQLALGCPSDDATQFGPLISQQHFEKVMGYINQAKDSSGTILTGGEPFDVSDKPNGYYLQPTLIEGLSHDHPVNQEEIFGPVSCLIPFDTEQEALMLANQSPYGLAASVWSNNIHQCQRVARALESGVVWVNSWLIRDLRTPFGGTKLSGLGREGGIDALRFFTEPQNICMKTDYDE